MAHFFLSLFHDEIIKYTGENSYKAKGKDVAKRTLAEIALH